VRLRKYKEISRRQVALGIQKAKTLHRFHKSCKVKAPVTFEDYVQQGLIIKKLFKEFLLPSRHRLGLTVQQYMLLRKLRSQHLKAEAEQSCQVHLGITTEVERIDQELAD
jgi:hypothetical protein